MAPVPQQTRTPHHLAATRPSPLHAHAQAQVWELLRDIWSLEANEALLEELLQQDVLQLLQVRLLLMCEVWCICTRTMLVMVLAWSRSRRLNLAAGC